MVKKVDNWRAIILAAGRGTRMKSGVPKVLQPICGREMVGLVSDALKGAGFEEIVAVVSPGSSQIAEALGDGVCLAEQAEASWDGPRSCCRPGWRWATSGATSWS